LIKIAIPKMPNLKELEPYLLKIEKSGIYSNNGPLKSELEEVIAANFGLSMENVAVCSNGTLGLAGLIQTSGIESSKKIVIPSWTFVATPLSVISAGFTPLFADVDLSTWGMNVEHVKSGSIYVSPFGYPVSIPDIESRIKSKNETLIIDAAASFSNYQHFNLKTQNRYAIMLSLHATKLIGAGEGGVIISNDKEWVKKFRIWTNFGFSGSRDSDYLGTNAKMSEYSAAVALASINSYKDNFKKFKTLSEHCRAGTRALNLMSHPAMSDGYVSPYWIIKLNDNKQKRDLITELNRLEIEWRDWWSKGCHLMNAFTKVQKIQPLDNTKILADLTIGLPFHYYLNESDIDLILQVVTKVVA
jgi:dTDP-4-amino-4,6-dideoxygalactose transaminase